MYPPWQFPLLYLVKILNCNYCQSCNYFTILDIIENCRQIVTNAAAMAELQFKTMHLASFYFLILIFSKIHAMGVRQIIVKRVIVVKSRLAKLVSVFGVACFVIKTTTTGVPGKTFG